MDLVFLYGPAASGKLTLARALSASVGYPVFHNHLIVDAIGAVFPFGSEPFVRLRQEFWLTVFREAAGAQRSIIFTFAPEPSVPADFFEKTEAAVAAQNGRVRYVELRVSDDEQDARIENADRATFQKLRSRDVLNSLRAAKHLSAAPPAAELIIDTEQMTPAIAAAEIERALNLIRVPPYSMFQSPS